MSFLARMTQCPFAYDPDQGAAALVGLPVPGELAGLLAGAAGSSPYLADLIRQEAAWFAAHVDAPEAAAEAVIAALSEVAPDQLFAALRQAKRRIALLTALADLGGVWPLEEVTATLTALADAAVQAALDSLIAAEVTRGSLPAPESPGDAAGDSAGMVVLAMGKMGAAELNYSSDIDLICLFDETRYAPGDYHDLRRVFVRVTQKMTALLSDNRGGYVFRTDLRLRPDPAVTPVCLGIGAAERYYESLGRTWERAAFIKARVCAGDRAAGARFLQTLTPFVWRRHLDFAAIEDAHDMRLKIRDHKGLHGPLHLPGHDMKLGRGGIREIEFFTQTRQLIAGGRDPSLRGRKTRDGLACLARAGWVPAAEAEALSDHYRFHRTIEHRLQMIHDAQTHRLPQDDAGFDRLAALMGAQPGPLRAELRDRLTAVHELTEGFFAPPSRTEDKAEIAVAPALDADTLARWQRYPALRTARAQASFARLQPQILAGLNRAANPGEALARFDDFLAGLPAGVQLFALFEANPALTGLIVDICATAPALAQYLSRNAAVLDAVIAGHFFAPWPGPAVLAKSLAAELRRSPDYETMLLAARRFTREWHFRVGVHHLRGLIDAEEAGRQYAHLAEAVLTAIWPEVIANFTTRHGPPPGQGGCLLAMGSLGAGLMTAGSDLDLIMIYDPQRQEQSKGARPLTPGVYFARLTQALVTALSAPMAEGKLYEVDMRLRPSGRKGPVATSLAGFADYQRQSAWTWEHLALTRARPLVGAPALMAEVEALRQAVLCEKSAGPGVLADVADMRSRLAAAQPKTAAASTKLGPGRLQDIALFAQTAALRAAAPARGVSAQLQAGVAAGWLDAADAQALIAAHRLWWAREATGRLLTAQETTLDALDEGAKRMMLRETGAADIAGLTQTCARTAKKMAALIARYLEGP